MANKRFARAVARYSEQLAEGSITELPASELRPGDMTNANALSEPREVAEVTEVLVGKFQRRDVAITFTDGSSVQLFSGQIVVTHHG